MLYFVQKFLKGSVISSSLLNKKLKVALTYNVKPEENISGERTPLSSNSNAIKNFNDTYAEWDSIETINAIKDSLQLYHEVIMIEANEDAFEKFRNIKPDIVFNVAECANSTSREAQIPAMLDMLQIPYSGSDPLTLTTCLDKARTKEVLSYHGIPTSKFLLLEALRDLEKFNLRFPVIMKPVAEGSSKGIFDSSLINNIGELKSRLTELFSEYNQPFLLEEFLPGREFTVAILGNEEESIVLPIVELNLHELPSHLAPIYSYEAKWVVDTKDNPLNIFSCPAKITYDLARIISDTALRTYKVLRCKDWSRIDIRLDANGIPNVIEINPLPGVLPDPNDNSCYPKAARTAGLSYQEMINKVLNAAIKRHNLT
ncbi:MAG: D-alanine-D-alanine ligase-like protein [Ignavibacteria bacterium]|nr:MAG: D-alanine-D-alanine ligase-like protein [Ignavibacteria bacterium]KAF0160380.1 MAG: D-alanine-D-alanine ligase-like protein [Ignavibacteria bacterium]